jgi:DNA-binding NarL/FixJ family response regulator
MSKAIRDRLSKRQLEVLRLICNGLNYQEIAQELGLSSNTVHNHARFVMQVFEVSHRGALIAKALGRTKSSRL